MSNVQHGATILAKRDELYQRIITKHHRFPFPHDRAIFDIAWEAKNNYAAIEELYLSIVAVVDEVRNRAADQPPRLVCCCEGFECGRGLA